MKVNTKGENILLSLDNFGVLFTYCMERYMENGHRLKSEHRRPEIRLLLSRLCLLGACHHIVSASDM